jgi:hypothetical protein
MPTPAYVFLEAGLAALGVVRPLFEILDHEKVEE